MCQYPGLEGEMGLLAWLNDGGYGVKLATPAGFVLESDDAYETHFVDEARGVGWYLFFFPKTRLDLAADREDSLRRDVEHHAHYLLETMRRREMPAQQAPFGVRPA